MQVTRFRDGAPYEAPGHHGMRCVRLQGREAGPADLGWMGVSLIEPGGAIEASASPSEKFYLVLEGELVFTAPSGAATLGRWDSCRFAGGESRAIENRSSRPAAVMLVMANAPPA